MAGATATFSPPRNGAAVELSRINCGGVAAAHLSRSGGASFAVKVSTKSAAFADRAPAEGPSCIFVGPIETASKETLEALYCQARDSYYSGNPLILDDMFDRVELKLRWYGSKSVVKYPRCSLRQHSTYADAEGRKILPRCSHWQVCGS
ncbi:hypothetical protein Syun_000553 [Stephania yunnanensis]|uniref:Uncharacterized protein n=1 Tax=Stephania yunnanensis TaxID=152371 RepID=A0AAP0Q677_9MAGN